MTTISQERAGLAAVGHTLRSREQWGSVYNYAVAQPTTDAWPGRNRKVTEPATVVFVHITVTNPGNYASDNHHARAVESIGMSRFPNTGISYNRLFFQSGTAAEAQPVGRRGAHTVNDRERVTCSTTGCPGIGGRLTATDTSGWNLNYNARGYAIAQNVADTVTDPQLDALARTVAADMLAGFVRRDAEIHGHRCVAEKDCPAGKMWARMGELRDRVDHYLDNGLEDEDMATPQEIWDHDIPNRVTGTRSDADDILSGTHKDTWDTKQAVEALTEKVDQILARLPAPPA